MISITMSGVVGVFALAYATWVLYAVIMGLKEARDEGRLTMALKVLGYPLLAVGYVFDAALNIVVSILMLHPVKEVLLTSKLQRIQREEPNGWRNATAKWICANILNPLDPSGHHC